MHEWNSLMTPVPPGSTGLLCVWRVFGVNRDWGDRPPPSRSWTSIAEAGPQPGDRMTVTVGEVPADIIDAVREWRATTALVLDSIFGGGAFLGGTSEEKRRLVADRGQAVDVASLKNRFPLYISLELRRELTDPLETEAIKIAIESFGAEASLFLDGAVGLILASLSDQLTPDALVIADRRAFLLRQGEPATTIPRSGGSAEMSVKMAEGWGQLPFKAIEATLRQLAKTRNAGDETRDASRLLCLALEHRDDSLRRFLFSFVGLEIMANRLGKRLRTRVAAKLDTELRSVPIDVLLWPVMPDEDAPYRNLTFRFACLAVALGGGEAKNDVGRFKELSKVRNDLAHSGGDIGASTARECSSLLLKYIAIVANAQSRGEL